MQSSELKTTGKQLFKVCFDGNFGDLCEIEVAIDFDIPEVKQYIRMMSLFWHGCPSADAPFKVHLQAWLQKLANYCFYNTIGEDWWHDDLVESFNKAEGYIPLDGSRGILLKSSWIRSVYDHEFEIVENTEYEGQVEPN